MGKENKDQNPKGNQNQGKRRRRQGGKPVEEQKQGRNRRRQGGDESK